MRKLENRSQLMSYFGAKQLNTVWSWCAVNESNKEVYLSVWVDKKAVSDNEGRKGYIVQEPYWGINKDTGSKSASRNDHDSKLSKIFNDNYSAFGYFVVAKDINSHPREIEHTKTSFVFSLELERLSSGIIIGYPLDRIEVN